MKMPVKTIARCSLLLLLLASGSACVTTGEKPEPSEESRTEAALLNTSLGVAYLEQGQLEVAMQKLQHAVKLDPSLPDAHNALAFLYSRVGEVALARDEYRTALRLDPDSSATMNNFGIFLCGQGDYKEAMKYFNKAVENPFYRTPAAAYTNAGMCALEHDQRDEAENYLRQALSADPDFGNALLQMSQLSYDNEIFLQARAFMDRFMNTTLSPPPDALWLGLQIEQAMGDNAAANKYADRLIDNYPDSVQTRWVLEMERNAG